MHEINELFYQYSKGCSIKRMCGSLGMARNTVRSLLKEGVACGLTRGISTEAVDAVVGQCHAKRVRNGGGGIVQVRIAEYHEQIEAWLACKNMTGKQVQRLLKELYDVDVSEMSLYRYLHRDCAEFFETTRCTVHLTTIAGEQAQVDFGDVVKLWDPAHQQSRRTYAFIMTLSHSRHRFVRFVQDQSSATWIDCHRRSFEFFGGVPKTILLDNLKAGVIKADIYDPSLNRSYAECARHYGFVADPAKVRTPQHKGKVERTVQIVRAQILAGREFATIVEANEDALLWSKERIGQVVCRTNGKKPYEAFLAEEAPALLPLPEIAFMPSLWKEAKVQRDCHVVFQGSFYSVPSVDVGTTLWVQGNHRLIRCYDQKNQLVKTHVRVQEKGIWVTDAGDYPQGSRHYLEQDAEYCLQAAAQVGTATTALIQSLVVSGSTQQLRKAHAILRLGKRYGSDRLERGCTRMAAHHRSDYRYLAAMLVEGREEAPLPHGNEGLPMPYSAISLQYLRDPNEFKASVPLSTAHYGAAVAPVDGEAASC